MQLIDKIIETSKLVTLSTTASDTKKQRSELERLNSYLKNNSKIINNYKESIVNLNKLDVNQFLFEDLSYYVNRISKIKKDNLRGIPISQNDFKSLINGLVGKSEALKRQWINYVINKSSQLSNTLDYFRELFEDSNEIKLLINKIDLIKTKWPVTDQVVNELNTLVDSGYDVINKLELTEDIQNFVRMVALSTATIEDLTPEIIEWIHKKKFANKLVIGFKSI